MHTALEACCGSRARRRRAGWLAFCGALGAIFAPKCPFCLAAYLSWAGVSVGIASFAAPLLRPLGLGIALFGLVVFVRSRL